MSRFRYRIHFVALAFGAVLAMGCSQADSVAVGPIAVGPAAREVMFFGPVAAPGPEHVVVLVFDRQRDSRLADRFRVVLVTPQGRRDSLHDVRVDRQGEVRMALRGHTFPAGNATLSTQYRSVELACDEAVTLKEIRWRSGGR